MFHAFSVSLLHNTLIFLLSNISKNICPLQNTYLYLYTQIINYFIKFRNIQMSKTKCKKLNKVEQLIYMLTEQINQLSDGLKNMNEETLLRQLAKHKVLYKISKINIEQLAYSHLALSQYCMRSNYNEPAIRNLNSSLELVPSGEGFFMLGVIAFKKKLIKQAKKHLEMAMSSQWMEPIKENLYSNRAQCLTYLQKIYYQEGHSQKLKQISIKKIQERYQNHPNDNHYAHVEADLANLYLQLKQYHKSLQHIHKAINTFKINQYNPEQLLDLYFLKIECMKNLNLKKQINQVYYNARKLVQEHKNVISRQKSQKTYEGMINANLK